MFIFHSFGTADTQNACIPLLLWNHGHSIGVTTHPPTGLMSVKWFKIFRYILFSIKA